MNKIIVLLAVLAMVGCAGTANEGAWIVAGGGHAGSGGGGEVSAPAHVAVKDVAPREVAAHHWHHRDAEYIQCAQCRH